LVRIRPPSGVSPIVIRRFLANLVASSSFIDLR
jgi:hypothetical protein